MWCWASFQVLIYSLYIFFGEMSRSFAHLSAGRCFFFLILKILLRTSACSFSAFLSLSEEHFHSNTSGGFPWPPSPFTWDSEESPWLSEGMWSAHLLVIYLLRICLAGKEPVPASSACFCDMWREITPVNLNPSVVFSCQISCVKNLQNLPFPQLFLSFLLLPHVVSTCQMQSMHLLIFTPSYSELLEVAVYETNENRKLLVHGLEDVVLIALEKRKPACRYPSKSVIASFCRYPASPRTATQWKREKTVSLNHNSAHC